MLKAFPTGHFTKFSGIATDLGFLKVGQKYSIVREFSDAGRQVHTIGESWTYLGHFYVPYDDVESIYVSIDGDNECCIPMRTTADQQADILKDLENYVQVSSD